MDDYKRLEDGTIQAYVVLTPDQIQKIHSLFGITDRDNISAAVQEMVKQYIAEHNREDVKKIQAENAWEDFKTKFDEGWFGT